MNLIQQAPQRPSLKAVSGRVINLSAATLAFRLADMFYGTYLAERLDIAFKKVAALRQSKPDKIVVSEIFHIRKFEKAYGGNILSEFSVS